MQLSGLNIQPTHISFVEFCWHIYFAKLSLVDDFNEAASMIQMSAHAWLLGCHWLQADFI